MTLREGVVFDTLLLPFNWHYNSVEAISRVQRSAAGISALKVEFLNITALKDSERLPFSNTTLDHAVLRRLFRQLVMT